MKPVVVSDFRKLAKRRLPGFVFDYMDGGAGTEAGIRRNEAAFDDLVFRPRYLVNTEHRDLSTELFGKRWSAPFGTAPIGMANIVWAGSDEAVARAAVKTGIPYTNSTAGSTTLERIKDVAGENAWFMLYPGRAEEVIADLVERADAAGYDLMMVTVDVPLQSKRPREIRNGWKNPFRVTPNVLLSLAAHPAWSMATFSAGIPELANMEKYTSKGAVAEQAKYFGGDTTGRFDWDRLKAVRDRWPRRMLIKGMQTAEDVLKARDYGVDGVVISNHGGRQSDGLPAPIDVLPEIRSAVGPDYPLLLDGGIRSGDHIVKALARGADFVLCGRAIMYAAAALGPAGGKAAMDMLIDEMSRCMGQIGYTDIASLKAAAPIARRG